MANSNSREFAIEPSTLFKRTGWCAVVFALAVLLAFLNFLPPSGVQYHVRSKVVVSEARLEQLRDLTIADREAVQNGEQQRIQMLSVKVLDLANQEDGIASQAAGERVVLVEIGTLWANRCTRERHYTWLAHVSKVDAKKVANITAAKNARFARWELATAEHYQSQYTFLASKENLPTPESSAQIAVVPERRAFELASYRKPASDSEPSPTALASITSAPIVSGDADFGLQLTEQIELAKSRVNEAEVQLVQQIEATSGKLQVAGVPVISPRTTSIPFWMAASIIVLGVASGASAGWFQYRRLAKSSSSLRLLRWSEWSVAFWTVLLIGRFLLDSVWRDVLVSSPLAAIGRLFAGMP